MERSGDDKKVATPGKTLSRRDFLRLGGAGLVGMLVVGSTFSRATEARPAARFEPPDGTAYTGVSLTKPEDFAVEEAVREWNDWTTLMKGKPAAISQEYTWFDNWVNLAYDFARAQAATPMITIEFTNASTKNIANAGTAENGTRTDHLVLRHAYVTRKYPYDVFVRLGHEMNGYWYTYCAYNEDGTPRPDTTEDYKQAWRRFVTIFRGGYVRDINAGLASYGLPPLDPGADPPPWMGYPQLDDPDSYIPPVENAAFVWCSSGASLPDVEGNAATNYYPGDDFVDWVGQDVYHAPWWNTIDSHFRLMDSFYREFSVKSNKPYMLAEWGLRPPSMGPAGTTSNDDPVFIERVLDWANARPKAKALVYYSWDNPPEGDYRLQKFPKSADALADGWKDFRFLSSVG